DAGQCRLGVEEGVPVGGLVQPVKQRVRMVTEQINHARDVVTAAVPAGDAPGRLRAATTVYLNRTGEVRQPCRHADLFSPQLLREALAVPLLVGLLDRGGRCRM